MTALLVLLLISVIITSATEVLKKLKDWVWQKQWKEGKFGIIFALLLGVGAGCSVGTNIVEALLQAMSIEYAITATFRIWCIICTSLLLAQGSAGIIGVAEGYKEGKRALEQALKEEK